MNKLQGIAAGADPEVLLKDKDGHPRSAEGRFGGTKTDPKPMAGLPEGFFVQEDNVAAEYNIPPASTRKEFTINIQKGLSHVRKMAKKQGLDLAIVAAMHFSQEELNTPHAKLLGCEPDLCVWTGTPNPRPIPPPTLRTAAGHVHVSWAKPDDIQRAGLVKLFDILLVIPSLLVTEPNERRSLYGRAGAARYKWYGVEARSMDNFWIAERAYCDHVFDQVVRATNMLNQGGDLLIEAIDSWSEEIQATINNHDVDNALRLMEQFSVAPFPMRV